MISSLRKPSSAAAVVAMAMTYIVLNINTIYSFQLSSPSITTTRAITITSSSITALNGRKTPLTADVVRLSNQLLQQQSQTTADDVWLKKDLEKELNDVEEPKKNIQRQRRQQQQQQTIKIIFSDIDGSLIHYPKHLDEQTTQKDNAIISLPPSATGLQGVISSRTLSLCRDLRAKGVKLVLVTGARTSTLLNRLPYLPKADGYCTEAGGRIFYPTNVDCCNEDSQFTYTPVEYSGSNMEEDLHPFGLQEDITWRKRMEIGGAGTEGYAGNNVFSNRCDGMSDDMEECLIDYENTQGFPTVEDEVPITQRRGHLWDFANQLVDEYGFVLDTKSYSTCFRVNKKHQTKNDKFDALLAGEIPYPETTIGKSTNLGCIDFYPQVSGKQNCCQYLAIELGYSLAKESVCICDDDNDIEMALACSHSYIPSLTSKTMVDTLRRNQSDFTQTFGPDISSTAATEAALDSIYDMT